MFFIIKYVEESCATKHYHRKAMKQKKNYLSHPDANLRANGLGKCYNICEEKYNTIKYNKMRL